MTGPSYGRPGDGDGASLGLPQAPGARLTVTGGRAAYLIRDFLTRNRIGFDYADSDDDGGDPAVPRCVLPDGTTLDNPTVAELAARLGLVRAASRSRYDLVVIGAGPAGLAAAVYASSEGLATAVVEPSAPGGQAGTSSRIENYLGFPDGISGAELADRARRQAERLGAELLLARDVVAGDVRDGRFVVGLSDGAELLAGAVLTASGVDWRRLEADGVERLLHAGVYYGAAASEAPGTRGKNVFVVGAGNAAGQAASAFADFAGTVTLLVRGDDPRASMSAYLLDRLLLAPNVRIRTNVTVESVEGDDWLRRVVVRSTDGTIKALEAHALFICIGGEPRTAWASRDGIALDPQGYVLAGPDLPRPLIECGWALERDPYLLESSRPGLFVAGDIRHGSTKRVATAVGEGAMAVQFIHRHLQDQQDPRTDAGRDDAATSAGGRSSTAPVTPSELL